MIAEASQHLGAAEFVLIGLGAVVGIIVGRGVTWFLMSDRVFVLIKKAQLAEARERNSKLCIELLKNELKQLKDKDDEK